MIGIMQATMLTKQRRLFHLAAHEEKTKAAKVDMTPVGIESRDDCTDVNPKFSMIMALNVVRPVTSD